MAAIVREAARPSSTIGYVHRDPGIASVGCPVLRQPSDEMTLGEGATRAGLEVLLECDRARLSCELH